MLRPRSGWAAAIRVRFAPGSGHGNRASRNATFRGVRPAVEREWFAERRSEAQAAQYQAVLSGYKVTVRDWPAAAQ